jgi:hypothetical protein
MPRNELLPTELTPLGNKPTFELLGTRESVRGHAAAFVPKNTVVDANEGVLILSPAACKELCTKVYTRAASLAVCAVALPVRMSVSMAGRGVGGAVRRLTVSVTLDFWVQILEPNSMATLYSYNMPNVRTLTSFRASPANPLPRIVFPRDTTPGREGMALYSSAENALQLLCGAEQVVTMGVADVPSLAALSVNRLPTGEPIGFFFFRCWLFCL